MSIKKALVIAVYGLDDADTVTRRDVKQMVKQLVSDGEVDIEGSRAGTFDNCIQIFVPITTASSNLTYKGLDDADTDTPYRRVIVHQFIRKGIEGLAFVDGIEDQSELMRDQTHPIDD